MLLLDVAADAAVGIGLWERTEDDALDLLVRTFGLASRPRCLLLRARWRDGECCSRCDREA